MKRTLGTIVLFVLLILTVVALTKLGSPQGNKAISGTTNSLTPTVQR